MAKLLANENVPSDAVTALRQAGHDVEWIREISPALPDPRVLARSVSEGRVLLTFDKDFGEMCFRHGSAASCGIILMRPRLRSPGFVASFAVEVMQQQIRWEGHFSVAQEGRLRVVPLPHRDGS